MALQHTEQEIIVTVAPRGLPNCADSMFLHIHHWRRYRLCYASGLPRWIFWRHSGLP